MSTLICSFNTITIDKKCQMIYIDFMTHSDLISLFMADWQKKNPKGRIYKNQTGVAIFGTGKNKQAVPYGIPAPNLLKNVPDEFKGGGGPDLFAYPGGGRRECFEVKTLAAPKLRPNQIRACKEEERLGFKVWIIKESPKAVPPWEIVRLEDYINPPL